MGSGGVLPPGGVTDLLRKLPFIVLYLIGAVWVAGKQADAKAFAAGVELPSPVMLAIFNHLLLFYLVICGGALLVLLLYLMDRKTTQEEFQRIGLTNSAGETPYLLRKERDKENPRVTVWIFEPNGISLEEWQNKQARIETVLNLTITDLRYSKGKRQIWLYTVPAESGLPEMLVWKDEYLSAKSFVLTLGEGFTGPVTVDLAKIPHILLGGSTGSGKSVLLKLLLMQSLKKGAIVCIADFKGGVDFPKAWRQKCRMCFDEQDLLDLLTALVDELERRKALLSETAYSNIDEYNQGTGVHLERYIFACDEIAEVLDKTGVDNVRKKQIGQMETRLSTIARQGRAFGIHLILATQRPDADILNGQIRNNLDCRICGRADAILSQIILGNGDAAEKIPKHARGRFLLHDGTLFQAYWFDEAQR
ncbi:MAG: FtsK/SpoIIIE domain-containing protein [Flavonifractor plautii]|nr:FtsK/SpoIIIE domain-containing protein [Flavonifractor plautii]